MELWVDKYRPKVLTDYVWQDEQTKLQVESWVKNGATDNVLLYGPAGVGKTSLAAVLLRELGVSPSDRLWMNASREGNIDEMRTKVQNFITTSGWSGMKYVVLDEADGLTVRAQESLKADIEEYSSTVRWILTANNLKKISDPIRDRCTKVNVEKPDRSEYETKMLGILDKEGITIQTEEEALAFDKIVGKNYPSLRGCIRDLQRYSSSGKLVMPSSNEASNASEWCSAVVDHAMGGRIRQFREILSTVSPDDLEGMFTYLYRGSERFGKVEDEAIIIISEHVYRHQFCADPEINVSGCLAKLGRLHKGV